MLLPAGAKESPKFISVDLVNSSFISFKLVSIFSLFYSALGLFKSLSLLLSILGDYYYIVFAVYSCYYFSYLHYSKVKRLFWLSPILGDLSYYLVVGLIPLFFIAKVLLAVFGLPLLTLLACFICSYFIGTDNPVSILVNVPLYVFFGLLLLTSVYLS